MEGDFERTQDHEVIRAWIEEHRGRPVMQTNDDNEDGVGIAFGDLSMRETISWEEFFDWFDTAHMCFQYLSEVPPGEEALSYSFVPEDTPSDSTEDETELPEANELAEDNLRQDFVEDEFAGEDELAPEPDSL